VDDLLEFGLVQRGLLGVQITDVDANVAERMALTIERGVLVTRVNQGSAAEESGIQQGDVITAINGNEVGGVSELQEWVARNRPGKEIQVTFLRGNEKHKVSTRLKNSTGKEEPLTLEVRHEWNGASFEDVPYHELTRLNLDGGVLLKTVKNGKWKDAGLREGFVIAYLDKVPVDNLADLNRILEFKSGGILVEGYFLNGEKGTYGLEW
jgi:S1-C subfamily serine protease